MGILRAISDWLKLLALIVLVMEAFLTTVILKTGQANPYAYLGIGLLGLIVVGLFYDRYLESRLTERRPDQEKNLDSMVRPISAGEVVTVYYIAPTLAHNEKVVDTTGAGDVFFAAYLVSRLHERRSIRESCEHATRVAARHVEGRYITEESLRVSR